MTSDTRDLGARTGAATPPDRIQLSVVQVAASALASVSAAVVASLFGVAGTVIGAGLVAVLSTTGSAIYSASMRRTSNQLRRARESLLTARAGDSRRTSGRTVLLDIPPAPRSRFASLVDRLRGGGNRDGDESSQSRWRRGWLTIGSGRHGLRWPALVGAVAIVFALAIGFITAFEAITQKPISALTGNSGSGTTTISSLAGDDSKATPTPTPSATSSSGGASGKSTSSAAPSATPSPQGGTRQSATPAPASPQPQQSAAPSTAPSQGSGSGTGSGSAGDTGGGTSTNGSQELVPAPVPAS